MRLADAGSPAPGDRCHRQSPEGPPVSPLFCRGWASRHLRHQRRAQTRGSGSSQNRPQTGKTRIPGARAAPKCRRSRSKRFLRGSGAGQTLPFAAASHARLSKLGRGIRVGRKVKTLADAYAGPASRPQPSAEAPPQTFPCARGDRRTTSHWPLTRPAAAPGKKACAAFRPCARVVDAQKRGARRGGCGFSPGRPREDDPRIARTSAQPPERANGDFAWRSCGPARPGARAASA